MNWLKNFQALSVCSINRLCFYPIALAATQLVSLAHYLSIPDSNYFTPMSVLLGLILGGAIIGTTELVNYFISRKEQARREHDKILGYATNPHKTHLYVVELLDGEIVYRFASKYYKSKTNRHLPEALEGRTYNEFHTTEEAQAYYNLLSEVIKTGNAVEFESTSPNHNVSIKSLTPYIDPETGRQYITAVSSNIRNLKETQKQLEHEAYHDALTGLANRRVLDDRIILAIARLNRDIHDNKSTSYICIFKMDLDNFKFNNDTYGHPVGDKLLIEVAKRLSSSVREIDTVVREGGDEFTLLLAEASKEGAVTVAKKIITEINRPYNINNTEHHLGISIGISLYPRTEYPSMSSTKKPMRPFIWRKPAGKTPIMFIMKQDFSSPALKRCEITGLWAAGNDPRITYRAWVAPDYAAPRISRAGSLPLQNLRNLPVF